MVNPYKAQPHQAFWAKTMRENRGFQGFPMERPLRLKPGEKIATAGSCFAQNITGFLMENYRSACLITEPPRNGEALFSARYGNIYTPQQLLELLQETRSGEADATCAIRRRDGRYLDRFRPGVESRGFATPADAINARQAHLGKLQRLFSDTDIFIFTLGMTEAWRMPGGRILPLCPAVYADETTSEFHNFTLTETNNALQSALSLLKEMNPQVRVILTVSPVPLTATFTDAHVALATSYSKSVLRVSCAEMEFQHDKLHYFPSYEMATNPAAHESFFDENARTVRPEIVTQIMAHFEAEVLKDLTARRKPGTSAAGNTPGADYFCDDLLVSEDYDH